MARNNAFDAISGFFGDIGRARRASHLYSDYSRLSDDALRARGIDRADLARLVFDKAFSDR